MRTCVRCDSKLTGRQQRFCKISCKTSDAVDRRRKEFKLKAVAYKGGACLVCGFSGNPAAFHFHHIVPEDKKFRLSAMYRYNWDSAVVPELDKCILVCANCHAIMHSKLYDSES